MKNILFNLIVICFVFSTFSSSAQSRFVSNRYNDVDNTIMERIYAASLLLENAGFEIIAADATYLSEKESYEGTMACYGPRDYVVLAVTGKGVRDLDLYVYDSSGDLVSGDTETGDDGATMVSFRAYDYERTTIKVKNYDSKRRNREYPVGIIVAYRSLGGSF